MVVDWRARISLAFYRASKAEPMGVELRRRFGFQHGEMTAYEDEDAARTERPAEEHSAILEEEIERPRVGPMRDIVATIQPEQDVIVRSDLDQSVCVQGAPGTGKTAVGLHRAAFLLYSHRDQLSRQGVLVVGPNASFLRYIGDVLPALGEIDAQQTTIEELVGKTLARLNAKYAVRGADDPQVATLKGDARLAEVLHRALWSQVQPPTEGLVVPRGSRRWRLAPYEVEEILAALRARGVRYGAARGMLAQRLAHGILVKMEDAGDSPDDRVQDAVARSREVKRYVDQLWPAVDPARLVLRLLGDPDALAAAADGVLTDEEQARLLWAKPFKAPTSARWSLADAVLIDEVADLVERTPSLGHVVADEAQDLSPMMLRAVGRRCSTGSTTVLGDLAQATTPWASRSWEDALRHLGKPDAHIEQLTKGFRVPGEVIEYAARLLPTIAPGLEPPTSVRRTRGELEVVRVEDDGLLDRLTALVGDDGRPGRLGRADHAGRAAPPRRRRPHRRRARARRARGRAGRRGAGGVRGAARRRARLAGQGPGVRPRGAARAGGGRGRGGRPRHRAAAALRLPDPGGHVAGGAAHRRPARGAGQLPDRRARIGRCPTSHGSGPRGSRWPCATTCSRRTPHPAAATTTSGTSPRCSSTSRS